jgi:hypothetical protein
MQLRLRLELQGEAFGFRRHTFGRGIATPIDGAGNRSGLICWRFFGGADQVARAWGKVVFGWRRNVTGKVDGNCPSGQRTKTARRLSSESSL